jgi:hypothetical protein
MDSVISFGPVHVDPNDKFDEDDVDQKHARLVQEGLLYIQYINS